MRPIIDQSSNIVLGHFWELFLEDAFQSGENDKTVAGTIIIDYSELNLASALFQYGGLKEVGHQHYPPETINQGDLPFPGRERSSMAVCPGAHLQTLETYCQYK
jgi:hypothetical protein